MTGVRTYDPDEEVTSTNTSYIHTLGFWGHSWVDTIFSNGSLSGYQIANRVFSGLGISWPHARNYGLGGSIVTQDWHRMLKLRAPFDNWGDYSWQSKFYPMCFLYGVNDVLRNGDPTFESSRFLNDWSNVWRGILSYFRAGAVHTPDWLFGGGVAGDVPPHGDGHFDGDALFPPGKAGVTYGGTWTTLDSTSLYACIGKTAMKTTVSGSTISVRLPPLFPGTPVTLYFGAEVGATGSTNATVTHTGTSPTSPVSLVTNDRVRTPATLAASTNLRSLYPVRIVGIPIGDGVNSQTITVNAGTLAAGHQLVFLGWTIEATHPPLMVVGNIPPAQSLAQPAYNTMGIPGNTNGSILQWPSYPQTNGPGGGNTQTAASGATAWNNGVRNTAQAQDSWCRSYYNPALETVANEFSPPGSVVIADLATVLDGSVFPELWGPNDPVHLDSLGKSVAANEFLAAMNRVELDPRHLVAPVEANLMAEAISMLGDHS